MTDDKIKPDILETIVQNIFRKAQLEKEYTIFYGDLCERMIKLELSLRGEKQSMSTMKNSVFRKTLFEVCKQCFEKFFDADEKKKCHETKDLALLFRLKLYGNLDFVGELYRRKLLPETVLISVFQSLLGISDMNQTVDDLGVEGAISLMNKVGQNFEERSLKTEKKKQDFDDIIKKFKEYENLKDETLITNRIKYLIKNMFTNKESGWSKTKDLNEGGPKTKAEVQNEVQEKYESEKQAQEADRRGHGRDRRDGGRNDDRGPKGGRDDRDRKGGKQFENRREGQDDKREKQYMVKGSSGKFEDDKGKGGDRRGGDRDRRSNNNKGGNDKRNDDKQPKQIEEITEEEMNEKMKKHFQHFVGHMKSKQDIEEPEEDQEEGKPSDEKFEFEVIQRLKNKNGKSGGQILYSLLQGVFDDEINKVEEFLVEFILQSDKHFIGRDYSEAISRLV